MHISVETKQLWILRGKKLLSFESVVFWWQVTNILHFDNEALKHWAGQQHLKSLSLCRAHPKYVCFDPSQTLYGGQGPWIHLLHFLLYAHCQHPSAQMHLQDQEKKNIKYMAILSSQNETTRSISKTYKIASLIVH